MVSHAVLITVFSGLIQVANSGCIGLKEILLSPDRPNYPNARPHLRVAMFTLSACLLYHGVDQIYEAFAHPPRLSRPAGVILSGIWLLTSALELERVARQWLPARVQRRFQQLMHISSCRAARQMRRARISANAAVRRGARGNESISHVGVSLAALAAEGVVVVAPMEGAEALDPARLP